MASSGEYPQVGAKENIYRLLYTSRLPAAVSAAQVEEDIEVILRWSRATNPGLGITGVLVTNKKMYSQVLEGPELVVKDLIGHIMCDRRHREVRIISHHKSDRRIFEDWSMAFIRTTRDLENEAYLFPSSNQQANIMAVSAFCVAVRNHIVDNTAF